MSLVNSHMQGTVLTACQQSEDRQQAGQAATVLSASKPASVTGRHDPEQAHDLAIQFLVLAQRKRVDEHLDRLFVY